eukprot:TRINITY_DN32435_c0_g1_i1.p2 TRINITY_DN32435_c0_g1~~TRINITY_DN32435_c0_g1_i1.p2  ORF type:complete len:167 (+),score=85.11 TRINITY_DN32435_c0_g1_i1:233-733(+)
MTNDIDPSEHDLSTKPKAKEQPIQSMTRVSIGQCRFSGSMSIGGTDKQATSSTGSLKRSAERGMYLLMRLKQHPLDFIVYLGQDDAVSGDVKVEAELVRRDVAGTEAGGADDGRAQSHATVSIVEMGELRIIEDGTFAFNDVSLGGRADNKVDLQGSISWHVQPEQ